MTDFDKDTWQTPKYFFRWLEYRFSHFHIDGCADEKNKCCSYWFGENHLKDDCDDYYQHLGDDLLSEDTFEKLLALTNAHVEYMRIFINPPYSEVTPFLKRAKELRDAGHTVVMLLNNDKSTKWYQNHIHNTANEVIDIIGGRIAFIHPVTGEEVKGDGKGQMVVVFDPTMEDFVQRSVRLDFLKKVGGYGN